VYTTTPSQVLGFHGCDRSIAERVVAGKDDLRPSMNAYDWLGPGIYFWEGDPARALEWARQQYRHPRESGPDISEPAVIGAIIDPGLCLSLTERDGVHLVRQAYETLLAVFAANGLPIPENRPAFPGDRDLLLRNLDSVVLQQLHEDADIAAAKGNGRRFDTVRSPFFEGIPLYPTSGFNTLTHIQICVRTPGCIKGYFLPRE
jgi:hypothetical protein